MNAKRLFFIALFALIALVATATYLYDDLTDQANPSTLLVFDESTKSPLNTAGGSGVTDTVAKEASSDENQTSGGVTQEKPVPTIPNFTVYDKDGNAVSLHDMIGKPIVLNFWASWCGPCKSEMPGFEEKYKETSGEILFVMINLTDGYYETVSSASKFIEANGYTFPVFYDIDSSASVAYNVISIPTTYFIDAEGNIVAQATGAISASTLAQGIDMIR